MEKIIRLLHEEQCSCVIENGGIRTFTRRGVADLYELLNCDPAFLKGASIADKVVGKAVAALMVSGGVKAVFADVVSMSALALLRESGVEIGFMRVVAYIKNRDQSGWCPLETVCYKEKSVADILPLIRMFIEKQRASLSA